MNKKFWNTKYINEDTGWDIGSVSKPLKAYIDQLEDKNVRILIPGCGNAYEAEYLFQQGFQNVYILDISELALKNFVDKCPDFPKSNICCKDFFEFEGEFDLILEQTFFCALLPELRLNYVKKMASLLGQNGKIAGLLFGVEFEGGPPFGGSRNEYLQLFSNHFEILKMEDSHNSIPPRQGSELFFIAKVKPN